MMNESGVFNRNLRGGWGSQTSKKQFDRSRKWYSLIPCWRPWNLYQDQCLHGGQCGNVHQCNLPFHTAQYPPQPEPECVQLQDRPPPLQPQQLSFWIFSAFNYCNGFYYVKEATAAAKKTSWYETRPAASHSSRYPTEKIRQKDRYGNQRFFETDDEAHQFPSSLRILLLYLLCKGDCTRKQNFVAADHTLQHT